MRTLITTKATWIAKLSDDIGEYEYGSCTSGTIFNRFYFNPPTEVVSCGNDIMSLQMFGRR